MNTEEPNLLFVRQAVEKYFASIDELERVLEGGSTYVYRFNAYIYNKGRYTGIIDFGEIMGNSRF